jgi:methionine-rich copper-binding protein CopC
MQRDRFTAHLALFLFGVTVLTPPAAWAHAFPDHASPAVGSVVAQSPATIEIWFTEKLEPSFSRIEVLDGTGQRVDAGDPSVDAQDARLLRVAVKKLVPGIYKVVWHVLSVDTHATNGDFTFTVGG